MTSAGRPSASDEVPGEGTELAVSGSSAGVAVPEVVGAPRTTWLQRLASTPGWLADQLTGHAGPLGVAQTGDLDSQRLQTMVRSSPRANGYLSLEPELSSWFDADGALTFARHRRAAFAVGGVHRTVIRDLVDPKTLTVDPAVPELLERFCRHLESAGFRRALFFPISASERSAYTEAGVETLMLGSEAFVDRATWSLQGKAKADLRQMLNRGRKRYGLSTLEYTPQRAAAELAGLHRQWLADKQSQHRMRLVVGGPGFDTPAGRRFFVVTDGERPVAFASFTPGWAGRGWGIDVMARPDDAPAGAMDVLIVDAMTQLFDEGARVLSLGAAPMAERVEVSGHDRWLLRRVFRWLYAGRLGNRLFHFESLARYKDKFDPRWEPVFMGGWPKLNAWSLYVGCRMWGLFGEPKIERLKPDP